MAEPPCAWEEVLKDLPGSLAQRPSTVTELIRHGVPKEFRWEVWRSLLHADAESVDRDPEAPGVCDAKQWRQIEVDLPRTFPEEDFGADLQQQLGRVLSDYAARDPATGYCQSMNYIAGLLLLVSQEEAETLAAFTAMMRRYGLSGLFQEGLPLMMKYCYVCQSQLRHNLPDLHEHFRRFHFRPGQYLHAWLLTLFVKLLPLRLVQYFWDLILFEGSHALVTLSLLVLRACEPFLLFLDDSEICRFFELIRMSDKLRPPNGGTSLECFWLELFRIRILRDFDAEHRQVLRRLAEDPSRGYSPGILDMEADFPARPPPPERLAEMVGFLPPANQSQAARDASGFLGFKRLTDPFVTLSSDTRDGLSGAMQRLHNILDKPSASRSRQRRLRET